MIFTARVVVVSGLLLVLYFVRCTVLGYIVFYSSMRYFLLVLSIEETIYVNILERDISAIVADHRLLWMEAAVMLGSYLEIVEVLVRYLVLLHHLDLVTPF